MRYEKLTLVHVAGVTALCGAAFFGYQYLSTNYDYSDAAFVTIVVFGVSLANYLAAKYVPLGSKGGNTARQKHPQSLKPQH
ncbi:MAG TPA: hypothetical protein VHC68_02425 [Candidatus Paceibacterota bacterium]|nr:hypothetical protein [Candidatus Paceibacterota bacterium]